MKDITVVLVTYNRSKCLENLMKHLWNQTYKINRVYVFDNCSTDNTQSMLYELGIISTLEVKTKRLYKTTINGTEYDYFLNDENLGGAGGFYSVISLAIRDECDYIWIMDDDVAPEPDCLEKLVFAMTDNSQACIPNRTDENFQDQACLSIDWRSLRKFKMTMRKNFAKIPFSEKYYNVKDIAFEGPLVDYNVMKKVGLPEKGFFIEYDDTDYATRILKYTNITFVRDAILHRQLASKTANINPDKWKYNWRNYYSIRNNILFNHRYCTTWRARHLSTGLIWLYQVIRSIKHRQLANNIRIINCAVTDGMRDRYGKVVVPSDSFAWKP